MIILQKVLLIIFLSCLTLSFLCYFYILSEFLHRIYIKIRYGKRIELCYKCRRTFMDSGLNIICIDAKYRKVEKSKVPDTCPYYLEHLV